MKEFSISRSLFDRPRKLILAKDYLEYEDKDQKGNEFTRFEKPDILDFKHGTNWIVWYEFIVGLRYGITIKNKQHKEIKISFSSYFGRKREYHHTMYSDIVNALWECYHSDIVDGYLNRFYNGEELEILGIMLTGSGIKISGRQNVLPWNKVGIKDYQNYFAVYANDQPELNIRMDVNQYGSRTLWSTLRTILKEKNEES